MISANRISIFTFSIRYLSDHSRIFLIYGNKSLFLYIEASDGISDGMLELNLQVWSPSELYSLMWKGSTTGYLAASKLWQWSLQILNNYEIV
jgi:hypothetical protein